MRNLDALRGLKGQKERGKEKLAENNKVEEASFAIDPYSNLVYKTDFENNKPSD